MIKFGQELFPPFKIEVFDSKNTSTYAQEKFDTEREAKLFTKMKSVPHKAVLHDSSGNWMQYTKGVVDSWSVNN